MLCGHQNTQTTTAVRCHAAIRVGNAMPCHRTGCDMHDILIREHRKKQQQQQQQHKSLKPRRKKMYVADNNTPNNRQTEAQRTWYYEYVLRTVLYCTVLYLVLL